MIYTVKLFVQSYPLLALHICRLIYLYRAFMQTDGSDICSSPNAK